MSLKIGALFAGYGGLDRAVESVLDSRVSWVAEFDDGPSRILAHRYPDAPNLRDVTQVDWSAVEPVDIITGGSPCQDLSHAGKRAGMKDGTRSGLWAAMCDAVETIRPSLVIWENVRGALTAEGEPVTDEILALERQRDHTSRSLTTVQRRRARATRNGETAHARFHARDAVRLARRRDREVAAVRRARGGLVRALGRVVGDLAELGYDAGWCGLRAADVGAPHGRWRVFVVAWRQDDAAALTWRQDDAAALLPTPVVNDMGKAYTPETWDEWTARLKASHGNGNGHGASLSIEALRLLKTPTSQLAVNGGSQHPDKRKGGGHGPTLADEVEHLLPTPLATDGSGAMEDRREASGHGAALRDLPHLLPTPRATDGSKGGPNQRGSSGDLMLPSAVTLMPTPSVADVEGGRKARSGARSDELLLNGIAAGQRFGDYTPAIARWEAVLGRPAPDPTEPTGRDGAHRLSPRFVEWLMGLPSGWVTDPAIWEGMKPSTARNAQLKALGNGVVPQQAAAAIRHILTLRDDLDPRKDSAA